MITSIQKHTSQSILDQFQAKFDFDKSLSAVHTFATKGQIDFGTVVEFEDQTALYLVKSNGDRYNNKGQYVSVNEAYNKVSQILN